MVSKYISRISDKLRSENSGFTLIEIMVVIVIISILAGLAFDGSRDYILRANDIERSTNAHAMAQKLEIYYRTQPTASGSSYPPSTISFADYKTLIGDSAIMTAPGNPAQSVVIASDGWNATQAGTGYLYVSQNFDGTICKTTPCARYAIYYFNEISNQYLAVNSMRQQ